MGMFAAKSNGNNKSFNVEQEMKKVDNEAISSIIDKSMTVTGEIQFHGKARIDGIIQGNIVGEHLILSESGHIDGDINVASFNCYGTIEGKIVADMISARKGCNIHGSLHAGTLTVEPGARIFGEIRASIEENEIEEKFLPEETDNQS